MSDTQPNLEFPEDMDILGIEDYMELSEEQWRQHIAEIMGEGEDENTLETHRENELPDEENATVPGPSDIPSTGLTTDERQSTLEINIHYAIVMVMVDNGLKHRGPRQRAGDLVLISGPRTNSAGNVDIETLYPTDDEVEIKHWKLIPCNARIQFERYWAHFHCKLQESISLPQDFVQADAKHPDVIECKIEYRGYDGNNNALLWVNMTVRRNGATHKLDMGCKRIVGYEQTALDSDEIQYLWEEELLREW